jgi:hypothetical protein
MTVTVRPSGHSATGDTAGAVLVDAGGEQVRAFDVVDVEGTDRRAPSAGSDPELFWALGGLGGRSRAVPAGDRRTR